MQNLLEIKNLSVEYYRRKKIIPAVRSVSLGIDKNETLGIVGESGCGKSSLALAILRLIQPNEGKISQGEILFRLQIADYKLPIVDNGWVDILKLPDEELRKIRGGKISIIFQDPFTSLNPVIRIGEQVGETIKIHQLQVTGERLPVKNKVLELLRQVKIAEPERVFDSYPHQLSGGMLQRVMIALAISANPKVLIADEPTTALDVTTQRQILELLKTLKKELNTSIILITHNFGIISEYADRVAVMYAGKIIEEGKVKEIFTSPLHPYTQALIRSLPRSGEKPSRLSAIPGQVPDMLSLPSGCKFNPRCEKKMDICLSAEPGSFPVKQRKVSCFLYN